jgi:hypothetical protein
MMWSRNFSSGGYPSRRCGVPKLQSARARFIIRVECRTATRQPPSTRRRMALSSQARERAPCFLSCISEFKTYTAYAESPLTLTWRKSNSSLRVYWFLRSRHQRQVAVRIHQFPVLEEQIVVRQKRTVFLLVAFLVEHRVEVRMMPFTAAASSRQSAGVPGDGFGGLRVCLAAATQRSGAAATPMRNTVSATKSLRCMMSPEDRRLHQRNVTARRRSREALPCR